VIDAGQSTEAFNLAVDPTDNDGGGTVVGGYLRANAGADKAQNPFQLMVWRTTDGGQSVTTHPVANLPSNPGSHFASFDVDTHGNVYAAWVEQGAWDVVYSVAKQTDLDHWTAPVRVNRLPEAATAVEPTIKVGDPGRVFIAYYGAPERANPDVRPGAEWNGYLATSVNGTCQLDATCAQPAFASSTITEHPVQYGGICLTPPACSADPYDGDGSVRRYLDVGIAPITGQVHVVLTDSSRANQGTTVTAYHQISGPSAFATGGSVKDVSGFGNSATDPDGDAIAAIQSVSFAAVAADIRKVELTRPAAGTLRVVMTMTDVTLFSQTLQQGGRQLIVGARFATEFDVFWVGFRFSFGGTREFVAGHLKANGPVDVYSPDAGITVTGTIDTGRKTITMDVPEAQLQTTLQAPKSTTTPTVVQGVVDGQALYGVTGISFVGDTAADDAVAKHWLDVAPSFSTAGAPMSPTALAAGVSPDLQARGSLADLPGAALPATGGTRGPGPVGVLLAVGLAFAALARRACSRSTQPVRSSQ
ncbi:MAG TPA: hypothetical protein VFA94_10060, partial [Acidimicrobiales bacterium]|nr:hypothetical protein [Acidimicrobiales bacterium]